MISIRPTVDLARRLLRTPLPDLKERAAERWEIAPPMTRFVPPAVFLPGQLDRIRGAEFGSVADVVRDFNGEFEVRHGSTLGFRLRDVDLVDGVLYAAGAVRHLRPRQRRRPAYAVPREVACGALYESWVGNRWFGNWLSDDCLTYPLAERFGNPVTTTMYPSGHVPDYEALLGMHPMRVERARFEELTLFQDLGQNGDKRTRADLFRARLMTAISAVPNPGVFLLRGTTGARRMLLNEGVVAERLAITRGFHIVDPATASVREIIATCAEARVIIGVEGSHLCHGAMVLPPGGVLLVLQPPDRVVSVLKIITDRQDQAFAFVVGKGTCEGFAVEVEDIERTLDVALR